MPNSVLGFTRLELVTKVLDALGRSTDTTLKARLNDDINFAQLTFWKLLDWKFAYKNGLEDSITFPLVLSQTSYTLNTATIGAEMRGTEIDKVYVIDPQYSRTIHKVNLRDIRNYDPGRQVTGFPEIYAVTKHNEIDLWPIPDSNAAGIDVYIDGKTMPTWLDADDDYPSIPIEYQETFYQYFLARTMSRERDPRQAEELAIFKDMLKNDQAYDLREVESNLRFKWPEEELVDNSAYPGVNNLVRNIWNSL